VCRYCHRYSNIFELNHSRNPKRQFLSAATIAFSELDYFLNIILLTVLRRPKATNISLSGHVMARPGLEGQVSAPWIGQYRKHVSIPDRNNRFSVIQSVQIGHLFSGYWFFLPGVGRSSAEVWSIQPVHAPIHVQFWRPQEQIDLRLWTSGRKISESLGVLFDHNSVVDASWQVRNSMSLFRDGKKLMISA